MAGLPIRDCQQIQVRLSAVRHGFQRNAAYGAQYHSFLLYTTNFLSGFFALNNAF